MNQPDPNGQTEAAPAPAAGEAEALRQRLAEAEARAAENWDKALRAAAELENVRRRVVRESAQAQKYALERILSELIAVADSLGVYLTHEPRPGRADAERNCVSNIHPPEGLGYAAAAAVVAGLVDGARRLGRSGVDLKDTTRDDRLDSARTGEL